MKCHLRLGMDALASLLQNWQGTSYDDFFEFRVRSGIKPKLGSAKVSTPPLHHPVGPFCNMFVEVERNFFFKQITKISNRHNLL